MKKNQSNHLVEPFLPDTQGLVSTLDAVAFEIGQRERYAYKEKIANQYRQEALAANDEVFGMLGAEGYEEMICTFRADSQPLEKAKSILYWSQKAYSEGILEIFSHWYSYQQVFQADEYHRWVEKEVVRRRTRNVVGRVPHKIQEESDDVEECRLENMSPVIVQSWLEEGDGNPKPKLIDIERRLFNYMIDIQDAHALDKALKRLPISLLDDYVKLLNAAIAQTERSSKIVNMEPSYWAKSSNGYLFFSESNPGMRRKLEQQDGVQFMTPKATRVWRQKVPRSTVIITDKMVEVSECVG